MTNSIIYVSYSRPRFSDSFTYRKRNIYTAASSYSFFADMGRSLGLSWCKCQDSCSSQFSPSILRFCASSSSFMYSLYYLECTYRNHLDLSDRWTFKFLPNRSRLPKVLSVFPSGKIERAKHVNASESRTATRGL